jgi:hypothetical protein
MPVISARSLISDAEIQAAWVEWSRSSFDAFLESRRALAEADRTIQRLEDAALELQDERDAARRWAQAWRVAAWISYHARFSPSSERAWNRRLQAVVSQLRREERRRAASEGNNA